MGYLLPPLPWLIVVTASGVERISVCESTEHDAIWENNLRGYHAG